MEERNDRSEKGINNRFLKTSEKNTKTKLKKRSFFTERTIFPKNWKKYRFLNERMIFWNKLFKKR